MRVSISQTGGTPRDAQMIQEDRALEQNAPRTRHLVFTASGHTDLFGLPGRKVVAQRDVQAEFNFHRLHQGRQHPCGWAPASAEQGLAQQRDDGRLSVS